MAEVLNAMGWQHTIPLAAIFVCLILRKAISQKISEIRLLRGEGKKWEALFEASEETRSEALPRAGQRVITEADVREAFRAIPDFTAEDIERHLTRIHGALLRQDIVTKDQLDALVSSDQVLSTLRTLYVEELLRPEDRPLDPVAVAVWAPTLFRYGVRDEIVAALRRKLRQSPEYTRKRRGA